MKKMCLLSAVILSMAIMSCGSSEEKKNREAMPAPDTSRGVSAMIHDSDRTDLAYVCPCGGCPEVRESKPGKCPKCQLDLIVEKK